MYPGRVCNLPIFMISRGGQHLHVNHSTQGTLLFPGNKLMKYKPLIQGCTSFSKICVSNLERLQLFLISYT
jgi:hypothetical protein